MSEGDPTSCQFETEFPAMFKARGDRKAQNLIRIQTPDAVHCIKLEQSAHACRGCEHNPYKKRADVSEKGLALIPLYGPFIRSTLNRIGLMDGAGITWSAAEADARLSRLMVITRAVMNALAAAKAKKEKDA